MGLRLPSAFCVYFKDQVDVYKIKLTDFIEQLKTYYFQNCLK